MQPFKLTIEKPCHENWENMTANEKGRFCNRCEKTVIDFTKKSAFEIQLALKNANGNVCGRVNTKDLNKVILPLTNSKTKPKFNSRWFAWLTVFAFLGFGKKAAAQSLTTGIQTPGKNIDNSHVKTSNTKIAGLIKHALTGTPLEGIEVIVSSGGREIATAFSGINGDFAIDLPANTIANFRIDIEFMSDAYELKTLTNLEVKKNEIHADVALKPAEIVLDPVDIVCNRSVGLVTVGYLVTQTYTVDATDYMNLDENLAFPSDTIEEINYFKDEIVTPKEISVKVYPNPTLSYVKIDVENATRVSIQVFSAQGQLIYSESSATNNKVLDFSKYMRGTYTLRVIDDYTHKTVVTKVVKMD